MIIPYGMDICETAHTNLLIALLTIYLRDIQNGVIITRLVQSNFIPIDFIYIHTSVVVTKTILLLSLSLSELLINCCMSLVKALMSKYIYMYQWSRLSTCFRIFQIAHRWISVWFFSLRIVQYDAAYGEDETRTTFHILYLRELSHKASVSGV